MSFSDLPAFICVYVQIVFLSAMKFCPRLCQDITNDPTGGFDKFKDFVEASLDICRWEGVFIVLAQVLL